MELNEIQGDIKAGVFDAVHSSIVQTCP